MYDEEICTRVLKRPFTCPIFINFVHSMFSQNFSTDQEVLVFLCVVSNTIFLEDMLIYQCAVGF